MLLLAAHVSQSIFRATSTKLQSSGIQRSWSVDLEFYSDYLQTLNYSEYPIKTSSYYNNFFNPENLNPRIAYAVSLHTTNLPPSHPYLTKPNLNPRTQRSMQTRKYQNHIDRSHPKSSTFDVRVLKGKNLRCIENWTYAFDEPTDHLVHLLQKTNNGTPTPQSFQASIQKS